MALVITMRTPLLAEGGAKGAGDTVAEFVVGSCSFLRRIAEEEEEEAGEND